MNIYIKSIISTLTPPQTNLTWELSPQKPQSNVHDGSLKYDKFIQISNKKKILNRNYFFPIKLEIGRINNRKYRYITHYTHYSVEKEPNAKKIYERGRWIS